MIAFESLFQQSLLSPFLPLAQRECLQKAIVLFQQQQPLFAKDHLFLQSSGTESQQFNKTKLVILSRAALLAAAESVVRIFELSPKDVYHNPLPLFHVGGVGVWARQHVAKFKVVESEAKWSVDSFMSVLQTEKVTCTSLVPTQVFDLISTQKKAPDFLRIVFVGAGEISPGLFDRARELGWPLVLTYGMTETCAMLAHKNDVSDLFIRLPHITEWKTEAMTEPSRLSFQSSSLLSGYLFVDSLGGFEFINPVHDGWYASDDLGMLHNDQLQLVGRSSELVKILGETVNLREVQNSWASFANSMGILGESIVLALPHERWGSELVLVSSIQSVRDKITEYNQSVAFPQRLHRFYFVDPIPRSVLGKVAMSELRRSLLSLPFDPIS